MWKAFNMKYLSQTLLTLLLMILSTTAVQAQQTNLANLPETYTPFPYAGVRGWLITHNLGTTGARFWVDGISGDSHGSRELLIKTFEPGTPADGKLRPYDVIIGAAIPATTDTTTWTTEPKLRPFDTDARLEMMRAITWAESDAGQGKLKLLRSRDGKTEEIVIDIPVMGDYSATAPNNCPKSKKIVEEGVAFLAEEMPVNGYYDLPGALNAMAMYASGDDRYLDHVRRSAMRMGVNDEVSDRGHETWRWGYTNTFLNEYYLATGDKRVLPLIKDYADALAAGQCNPGTWGHRAVPDFVPPGYGSLNSSGVVCFISLILSNQSGVEYDTEALKRSIKFYGSYAGRGGIPYGDHPPDNGATSNGKNGMGAVAFAMLGAEPAAQWFARLCASANLRSFEGGHTGNFFNQTWAPLGASLAGEENYAQFWKRFNSYRDMARRHDGSMVTQPWPHRREGDLGTGNYIARGPLWSTGGLTLSYLAGNEQLATLGRRDSVFAKNPPKELEAALALYDEKNFEAAAQAAAAFVSAEHERLSMLAKQLQTASQRNLNSLDLTLAAMQANLEQGDLYELQHQLQAIESIIDLDDPRVSTFVAVVNDPANEAILADGQAYHQSTHGISWVGPSGFRQYARPFQIKGKARSELERLAREGKGGYQALAQAKLDKHPLITITPETPLFDNKAKDEQWHVLMAKQAPEGWTTLNFRDASWSKLAIPTKDFKGKSKVYLRRVFEIKDPAAIRALMLEYETGGKMTVYLNGVRILDTAGGGWPPRMFTPLRDTTLGLLREGKNCLALELTPDAKLDTFDCILKATIEPQR